MAKFLKGAYRKDPKGSDDGKKAFASGPDGKKARMALVSEGKSFPDKPKPMNRAQMRGYGGAK